MNEPTAEMILDCLAFFALSDEGTVDPDSAVWMLESLATSLRRLDPAEQRVLLEAGARRAAAATAPEVRAFFADLAEGLGLRT